MYKILVSLVFLFAVSFCSAQKQNVYFLKNNGTYVTVRDSADYFRIVREPDSASVLYNVFEFYKNGKKKSAGKSIAIDPPKYEGPVATFYNSGKRKGLTNYKNNIKTGQEFLFFPNGRPYLVLEYPENQDVNNSFSGNFLIKENFDSLGTVLITEGNGHYNGYDDNFKYIEEEGNVKEGKRDGIWKGDFKGSKITFVESYKNGELITGTTTDANGIKTSYSKSRGVPPEFPGGLEAFAKYLAKNINYPYSARLHEIQGTVVLSFIVEKDGKLSEIKVHKSVDRLLDDESVRVLKRSPPWVPGTQFGKPVRVVYSVPVSFTLSD